MKPYMDQSRRFEDPLDGPYPTGKQTKVRGSKRRPAIKRKMRVHKKGARRAQPED